MMKHFLTIAAAALALLCASACKQDKAEKDFNYIVQVFTGGWNNRNYETADIIARIDTLSRLIPIEKVIIGWNLDPAPYKEIGEFLHSKDIQMILWLPVFSETGEIADCEFDGVFIDKIRSQSFLAGTSGILSCGCDKYPGIEVNYREEFARTDPDYIKESIQAVKDAGFSGAVLSWDIMLAPDSHISCLQ